MSTPAHRMAPGPSYFVKTKCWQGRSSFQVVEIADLKLKTLFEYRERGAYLLHEFVSMPDHIHLLLTPGTTSGAKAPSEPLTVQALKPPPPKEHSSASREHPLNPIPQGLKFVLAQVAHVGEALASGVTTRKSQ